MSRTTTGRAALILMLAALPAGAGAWEADTTHAGLTEQAAVSSSVHGALTSRYGQELGWYQPLIVPPAEAQALFTRLKELPPSSGFVPDARGEQSALAWLLAGAVLEDMPAGRGANHFFEPSSKRGLSGSASLAIRVFGGGGGSTSGKPAVDWIFDQTNDLNVGRFWQELELATVAPSRAERDLHLAYALIGAGALLHVLEDMGSPSHVRNDWSEHLGQLGGGKADRGSRFERLAALLYGSLGVPAPDRAERRARLRDYFTSSDGRGLADVTNASWFSSGTLPDHSRFSKPAVGTRVPADAPRDTDWTQVERDGVCLTDRRMSAGRQEWGISDECAAEQITAILPSVGAYATGLLDFLFRGTLVVNLDGGQIAVSTPEALGAGKVKILVEDEQGARRELTSAPVTAAAAGATLATLPMDGTPARVIAVYRGVDANGEEIVAVGGK